MLEDGKYSMMDHVRANLGQEELSDSDSEDAIHNMMGY